MKVERDDPANHLGLVIAEKMGLKVGLQAIVNSIERELALDFEPTGDEEDPMDPRYGSDVATGFWLVYDGDVDDIVSTVLTEDQIQFLKQISVDGRLQIDVVRSDDYRQRLTFKVELPVNPTILNGERITVEIRLITGIFNTRDAEISAIICDVSESQISKISFMYSLTL